MKQVKSSWVYGLTALCIGGCAFEAPVGQGQSELKLPGNQELSADAPDWRWDYLVPDVVLSGGRAADHLRASAGEVVFGGAGEDVIVAAEGGSRVFDGHVMLGDVYGSYASDGEVDHIFIRNGVPDHAFIGSEDFLTLEADPFDLVSIFDESGRSNGNEGGTDLAARTRYAVAGGDWDLIRLMYEAGFLVPQQGPASTPQ